MAWRWLCGLGDRGWLLNILNLRANPELRLGRFAQADRTLLEMRDMDPPVGHALAEAENRAWLLALRDEPAEADAVMASAAPLRAQLDDPRLLAIQLAVEAFTLACRGDFEGAYAKSADVVAGGGPAAPYAGEIHGSLRSAHAPTSSAPEPVRLHSWRCPIAAGCWPSSAPPWLQVSRRSPGRRDDAVAAYRECVAAWREMDQELELGQCLADFAMLVGPSMPEARAAGDEAREIYTRSEPSRSWPGWTTASTSGRAATDQATPPTPPGARSRKRAPSVGRDASRPAA